MVGEAAQGIVERIRLHESRPRKKEGWRGAFSVCKVAEEWNSQIFSIYAHMIRTGDVGLLAHPVLHVTVDLIRKRAKLQRKYSNC